MKQEGRGFLIFINLLFIYCYVKFFRNKRREFVSFSGKIAYNKGFYGKIQNYGKATP